MTSPTNPDEPTQLSETDAAKIRQAIGRMPYGGGLTPHELRPETVDGIVDTLDHLAAILRGIADRNRKDSEDLRMLLGQRAAVRAFLGTGADL